MRHGSKLAAGGGLLLVLLIGAAPALGSDYTYTLSDVVGESGAMREMSMTLDSTAGEAIDGWSYGVAVPPGVVVDSVVPSAEVASINGGYGPSFHVVHILDDGYTVGVVLHAYGAVTFLPGVHVLEVATLELGGPEGASEAEIVNTMGEPSVASVVVSVGTAIYPTYVHGEIIVGPVFQRGDCNADGNVDIADSIFVESYLFLAGEIPSCLRACDTNDDGLLNIADSIYGLNYLFADGPPPAAPHFECGIDPTPDLMTCEVPAQVCS